MRRSCEVARAHGGTAVPESGAAGRGRRLRALARALARRHGDAVVHEPRAAAARTRAVAAPGGGRQAQAALSRPGSTNSSAPTTRASANTRPARCSRPCWSSTTRRRRAWWPRLAREALFDAANAEVAESPTRHLLPRGGRVDPAPDGARPAHARPSPCPSATSCAAASAALPMSIEGELRVTLHWDGQRVRHVALRSTRPLAAARVLQGRRPAEAAALVPRLLRSAARRRARPPSPRCARRVPEAAGMPDAAAPGRWPWRRCRRHRGVCWSTRRGRCRCRRQAAAVGRRAGSGRRPSPRSRPGPAAGAAGARRGGDGTAATSRGRNVYGGAAATGCPARTCRPRRLARHRGHAAGARAGAAGAHAPPASAAATRALMPGLDDAAWLSVVVPALLQRPAFARAPTWGGGRSRPGALARTRGQPLVAALIEREGHSAATRLAARLVELAQLLGCTAARPRRCGPGCKPGRSAAASAWRRCKPRAACCCIGCASRTGASPTTASSRRRNGTSTPRRPGARARRHCRRATKRRCVAQAGLAVHALDPCVGFRRSRSCAMHEMSLAEGMLRAGRGRRTAQRRRGRVKRCWLEIGALSQVEVDALRFCFDAVTRGTLAEGARLEIVTRPGAAWCMPCGERVAIGRRGDACPRCGSYQLQVCRVKRCGSARSRLSEAAARETKERVMCITCGCGSDDEPCRRRAGHGTSTRTPTARRMRIPMSTRASTARAPARARHRHADGTGTACPRPAGTPARHHDPAPQRVGRCRACARAAPSRMVQIERDILAKNDAIAAANRQLPRRPRHLRPQPRVQPGLGQDDAAGEDDRGAARAHRRSR